MAAIVTALRVTDVAGARWPVHLAAFADDPHRAQMVEPERLYALRVGEDWLHLWWVRDSAGQPLVYSGRGVFVMAGRAGSLRCVWDAVPANARMTINALRDSTAPDAMAIKALWGDRRPRDELGALIGDPGEPLVRQYDTVLGYAHHAEAEATVLAEVATAVPTGEQWTD